MFKKKNQEKVEIKKKHKLITVYLVEYGDNKLTYWYGDINQIVDWGMILDAIAFTLEDLVRLSKEQKIPVPKDLNNFKYKIPKKRK